MVAGSNLVGATISPQVISGLLGARLQVPPPGVDVSWDGNAGRGGQYSVEHPLAGERLTFLETAASSLERSLLGIRIRRLR